ncbi:hypothetical protein MNBD_BACTEROID01-1865, partial [hydrothermal vent metagenome]
MDENIHSANKVELIYVIPWRLNFLTIALFNNLYGQKPEEKPGQNFPAEKLTVHITQECAFPGEVVWFKIYCTSPLYPEVELSRMAYIELVNSDNASLLRKKILLEGGEGEGAF